MKKILLLLIGFLSIGIAYSQDARIFNILSQGVLEDKDVFRYIPLKMIDQDSSSTYSVPRKEVDLKYPLIKIIFSEPIEVSALSIQAGYFDARYFLLNDRIKKVHYSANNGSKTNILFGQAILEDKMETQKINFGQTKTITDIDIYIDDIFPGTKWDDICISEIGFDLSGSPLILIIDPRGSLAKKRGISSYYQYENGKLIQKHSVYSKAFDETEQMIYGINGELLGKLSRIMNDPKNDRLSLYFYADENKLILAKIVVLDHYGNIISTASDDRQSTNYLYIDNEIVGEYDQSLGITYIFVKDSDGHISFRLPVISKFSNFVYDKYMNLFEAEIYQYDADLLSETNIVYSAIFDYYERY